MLIKQWQSVNYEITDQQLKERGRNGLKYEQRLEWILDFSYRVFVQVWWAGFE